jgi:predicted transcriptional regulator
MSQSFYFDPNGQGLSVFLGPTEVRLMELCWEHGPLTVKKAIFYWNPPSKPAYTTVMTVLGRLAAKGLLKKVKQAKSYVYEPVFDRQALEKDRLQTVLACLRANFPQSLRQI